MLLQKPLAVPAMLAVTAPPVAVLMSFSVTTLPPDDENPSSTRAAASPGSAGAMPSWCQLPVLPSEYVCVCVLLPGDEYSYRFWLLAM
jgi:hypothetical protein